MRIQPRGAVTYGIDLGKTSFHVVGLDATGQPIQRLTLGRTTIFQFFGNAAAALIGMEACPGSQWLARKLQALGHTVRIIPAQFVKPYVKSNKNDTIDAEAIAEVVAHGQQSNAILINNKGSAPLTNVRARATAGKALTVDNGEITDRTGLSV